MWQHWKLSLEHIVSNVFDDIFKHVFGATVIIEAIRLSVNDDFVFFFAKCVNWNVQIPSSWWWNRRDIIQNHQIYLQSANFSVRKLRVTSFNLSRQRVKTPALAAIQSCVNPSLWRANQNTVRLSRDLIKTNNSKKCKQAKKCVILQTFNCRSQNHWCYWQIHISWRNWQLY